MNEAPKFTASPERTALLTELRKLAPGESITFSALSAAVGFDVERMRHLCYSVRSTLQANGGGTIDAVPGGLRRLTDAEVVNLKTPQYERKARGAARRGVRALAGVAYDGLSDTDKREHNVRMSTLGAMRLVTSRAAAKEIRAGVEEAGKALDYSTTLKLFGKVK